MKQLLIALLLSFCCYTVQAKDLILKFNIDTIAINGNKTATQRLSEQSYIDAMKSKESGVAECVMGLMLLQQNLKDYRDNLVKGYYAVKSVDIKVIDDAKSLFNKNDFSLYLSEIDFYNKIVFDKTVNDKVLSTTIITIKSPYGHLNFVSPNKKDMIALSDSLVSNAKRRYVFKSEENSENTFKYEYVNTKDDSDRLYIYFHITLKGENKDLEIKGVPEYRFEFVSGRFLDLFPFWSKFINPDENMEELQAKGVKFIKRDNMTYLINKSGENWSIKLKNY